MNILQELADSELVQHISSFGLPLQAGADEFVDQLNKRFTCSRELLTRRANDVLQLRKSPKLLNSVYESLQGLSEAEKIIAMPTSSDTEKAAEGQIFFQDDMKPFNSIPFLVTAVVFFKIWIFPVLGLMTPLLLFISPYIILQSVFGMNIPWEMYIQMMKQLVLGINGNEPWTIKHYLQVFWTLASLGQGIFQPFVTSYHTAKVDKTIVRRGEAFIKIHSTVGAIYRKFKHMGLMRDCPLRLPEIPSDVREVVAWMNAEPAGIKIVKTLMGRITILTTLAIDRSWSPVVWAGELTLSNLSDLAIHPSKKITSSVSIQGHTLLTGPNRGGKSSSLRAILQQVILGQVFGFTKDAQGSWNPFYAVLTRLKSRDTAGKESLFEMEVRRASQMIHSVRSSSRTSLVLIDELFHSTNPPDAEISARIFLDQLWVLPKVKSIISTHIFSLCEDPPENIKTLCCPATVGSDNVISYTYTLREGVCSVSSVSEVLKESGLLRA
jgi:hypothetical protein